MSTVNTIVPIIVQNDVGKLLKHQTSEPAPKPQNTINNNVNGNFILQLQSQHTEPTYERQNHNHSLGVQENILSPNDSLGISQDNIENDHSSSSVANATKYSVKIELLDSTKHSKNKAGHDVDSHYSNHLQVSPLEASIESLSERVDEGFKDLKYRNEDLKQQYKDVKQQYEVLKNQNDKLISNQIDMNRKLTNIEEEKQELNNKIKKSNKKERKKVTIIFFFSSFLTCFIWILIVAVFKSFKAPLLPKYMERKIHQIFVGLSFGLFLESTWTPADVVEAALFLKYKQSDEKCKNSLTRCCYIGGWLFFFYHINH